MADKYVKLDDALRACTEHEDWYRETNDQFGTIVADDIFQSIINLPTADVVEVVRCRKCKHHHLEREPCHGKTEHFCSRLNMQVFANFHCGYGERRDT